MSEKDPRSGEPVKPEEDYYSGLNPLVLDMVPKDCSSFLEVGCAKGRLGAAIKGRNPGTYYVGIEKFEVAGREAEGLLDKVFIADVERFDWSRLSGERFDCIIFADVLEHLLDPAAVLLMATSLLSLEGRIICCLPNVSHWSIIKGLIRGEWDYTDSGVLDRTHVRFYTVKSARKLLKSCGLQVGAEAAWRTGLDSQDAMLPLLRSLEVDPEDFESRSTILQYVFTARRIENRISAGSWSFRIPGGQAGPPAHTMAIVVCISDRLKVTDDFLESVSKARSATCAPHVIIIDDASEGGTPALLQAARKKLAWLDIYRVDTALGLARARNLAAGMTDAEVLFFLDGNSILGPACLEKMLERLADGKVGMVGPLLLNPDGSVYQAGIVFTPDARPVHLYRSLRPDEEKVMRPMVVPAITGGAMMIKREIFQGVGGFSTQEPVFFSDLDLSFKIRKSGLAIAFQPEGRVVQRETGDTSAINMAEEQSRENLVRFIGKWKDFMLAELQVDPAFYLSGRDYRNAGS